MESINGVLDSTKYSKYDYILNSPRVLIIPLTRCDHLINRPSDIVIKQEYIPTADDYNDYQSSQIKTGCEIIEKADKNGTKIKIERDYINGCIFENIVSTSNSGISEKSMRCIICNKMFTRNKDLKMHMRIHTGKKPFKCEVCGKVYSQKMYLKFHTRTHTSEKPYKCDVCKISFSACATLSRHKRTHTGVKPYKCKICNKAFSQGENLKRHKKTHTGEKPFKCKICNTAFSQSSNLKVHTRTHTGEKLFECDICSKTYAYKCSVKKHITNIHLKYL